jgi:acetoin utilization deacetylase AcuC-like enzyme
VSAGEGPRPLHAWSSDHVEVPLPDGHPFPMAKYRALREALLADGTLEPAHLHRSAEAPLEWLHAAHDPGYVARVIAGDLDAAEVRRLGLPWSPALVTRARASLHGTVMAARAALAHGVAGNLAGGTHHAFRDRGEAYCVFNDVAVAIAVLRGEGRARRPFVLDLDVHQGNGTAAMFADDPSVFTFSMHGAGNYPHRKERGSLDVELPDGCGDEEYLGTLSNLAPRALDAHAPDLVFYQAGVDGLAEDRLGRLALTHAGLAERDRRVFAWCEARGVPVVVTLGGGYARPLEPTVRAYANLWREARAARERRPPVHDG